MIRLWRKELRQLLPVTIVWLITSVLGIVTQLLSNRPDEVSFSEYCDSYCTPGFSPEYAVFTVIFALTFAYSLFPREHDEATINFLRPLPVARTTVFWVKFIAALSAIVFISLFTLALEALMLSFNRQSLEGGHYPAIGIAILGRDLIFAAIILCHGMLLSWFRFAGLLIYAGYFIVLVLVERYTAAFASLNVLRITDTEYAGEALVLNWPLILQHTIAAVVILMLAAMLWTRRDATGDNVTTTGISRRRQWAARFAAVVAFLVTSLLLIGSQADRSLRGDSGVTSTGTQYYRFVYRDEKQALAEPLLATADTDYETLRRNFQFEPSPVIQVDATADRSEVAGLAQWKKVIMELSFENSESFTRHILNHEATHVFQSIVADANLRSYFASVRFFIEGMAEYAAYSVAPLPDAQREKDHLLASISAQRHDIDFALLANDSVFSDTYDIELHYTLGDLWVASLSAVCGDNAPTEVLTVFADPTLSRLLTGTRLWETVLQRISCSLQDVNAHWQDQQAALLRDNPEVVIPALDQMMIDHQPEQGVVLLTANVAAPESDASGTRQAADSYTWRLRIKSGDSLQPAATLQFTGKVTTANGNTTVTYRVPARHFNTQRFTYQPGIGVFENARTYWQTWESGSL